MRLVCAALCAVLPLAAQTAALPAFREARNIDAAMRQAIREDRIPGGVVLIGHDGGVVFRKTYGFRSHHPNEPMTLDTIFDIASLTKVLATAPCLMKLFEQGRIRLNDRVTAYLPEFQGGKSEITVRDLLTHFSGLPPDLDLTPPWSGYETGIKLALATRPEAPPGVRFAYSDINFILLGEIAQRLTGMSLAKFARETVYAPLDMTETTFLPPRSLVPRIAPTEQPPGMNQPFRGVVHDPTARAMGGVAGHAGLFSTAGDLAQFAEMMIGMGQRHGIRLFQAVTVEKFTTPQSPADQPILRGLGWDIDSPFSGNRGELFPIGSYGHTGFTGTSLWIDPFSRTYVILLTNSVYPHVRPAITPLRARIATIAAAAFGIEGPKVRLTGYDETLVGAGLHREIHRNGHTRTGLDVLDAGGFAEFKGKRVGLITNHTGLTRDGRRNVDAMRKAGIDVIALFAPEHGIAGKEDTANIGNSTDPATGIRVWSLYNEKDLRPSAQSLRDIDVLVFDIQDVGARFYTYLSTMNYAMREAARHHLPFYVLDRPNPITGVHVEGPVLDPGLESFIGCFEMPLRHGMTAGELAAMMNAEQKIGAVLKVIPMQDWQRGDWFDATGLTWVDPSPNLRSLNAALLYPGLALLEASKNYSVGRGTEAPFEQIGANWIRGTELAAYLNGRYIPGIRIYPTRFRPQASNCAGVLVEGVRFVVTDRNSFNSERLGLEVAAALLRLYPGRISLQADVRLIGDRKMIADLQQGKNPRRILESQSAALRDFIQRRERYLLYR